MATAVYPIMAPGASDPLQSLIVKAAYFAQAAAEAAGSITMAGPYPVMTPGASDPIQMAAVKLTYWLQQLVAGSSGLAITNAALSGATPATDGSITTKWVFDTDTGYLWYNSGTVATPTWNNV